MTKLNQPKEDIPLGGCLPEGELQPDMQHSAKIIAEARGTPLFHEDAESVNLGRTVDISSKLGRLRRATDMQAMMQKAGLLQISEEDAGSVRIEPENVNLFGRIE